MPEEAAAAAPSNGENQVGLNPAAWSGTPATVRENVEANWHFILRAPEVPADAGDTTEGTPGEPSEEGTGIENSSGPSAGSMLHAPGFTGRGLAQSVSAAGGRSQSAAGTTVRPGNAARANLPQPSASIPAAAASRASAAAWSTTKTTGGIAGSSVSTKNEKKATGTQNAEVPGQAAPAANRADETQVSAYAAQAAAQAQANLPIIPGTHAATQDAADGVGDRVNDGGARPIDDQPGNRGEGPAAKVDQRDQGTSVPVIGTKGASSAAPAAAGSASATARASGQVPVRAAQVLPGKHATDSGATAGIGLDDRGQNEEQEDNTGLPTSTLTAETIAPGGVSNASGSSISRTNSNDQKTAAEEMAAHRGAGAASEVSAGSAPSTASTDRSAAETGSGSPQPLAQTLHESGAGGTAAAASQQEGLHIALAQNPGMEIPGIIRDPGSAHGAASSAATIGSSTVEPAATPAETFAALDAGSTVGTPSWVHAGSREAEAGFEDPALGWVSVRADLSASGVHAAVVPGSTEAAEVLSGHLPGLSAYLSEEHAPVTTLTVAAPGNSGVETGRDQGMSQGADQGWGQGAGQGMQQSANGGERNPASAWQVASQSGAGVSGSATSTSVAAGGFDRIAYAGEGRGAHISVMA
jgi:hypothetical protein